MKIKIKSYGNIDMKAKNRLVTLCKMFYTRFYTFTFVQSVVWFPFHRWCKVHKFVFSFRWMRMTQYGGYFLFRVMCWTYFSQWLLFIFTELFFFSDFVGLVFFVFLSFGPLNGAEFLYKMLALESFRCGFCGVLPPCFFTLGDFVQTVGVSYIIGVFMGVRVGAVLLIGELIGLLGDDVVGWAADISADVTRCALLRTLSLWWGCYAQTTQTLHIESMQITQ